MEDDKIDQKVVIEDPEVSQASSSGYKSLSLDTVEGSLGVG